MRISVFTHTLLFVGLLVFAAPCHATDSVMSLAQSGKTEEAYELLLQHPETNAVGYYNLGTLALKAGHVGPAIAYLEKANTLKRHDPDFLHNLELARTSLAKTLGGDNLLDPASTWTEKLADHLSLEELRGVLGLLALAVALLWIRVYLRFRNFRKCLLDPGSMLGFVTLALVTALYFVEREAAARPPAILIAHASVRSGPGVDFASVTELDAGVKLRMLGQAHGSSLGEPVLAGAPSFVLSGIGPQVQETQPSPSPSSSPGPGPGPSPSAGGGDWLQVRYSGEEIGWIPASSALVID